MLDSDDLFNVSISYTVHSVMQVHGGIAVVNPEFDFPAGLQAFTIRCRLHFEESVNSMQGFELDILYSLDRSESSLRAESFDAAI